MSVLSNKCNEENQAMVSIRNHVPFFEDYWLCRIYVGHDISLLLHPQSYQGRQIRSCYDFSSLCYPICIYNNKKKNIDMAKDSICLQKFNTPSITFIRHVRFIQILLCRSIHFDILLD